MQIPETSMAWNKLFSVSPLLFPRPTPKYTCPKWWPGVNQENRECEIQYFHGKGFLFFLIQASGFWEWGKRKDVCGPWTWVIPWLVIMWESFPEWDFLPPSGVQGRQRWFPGYTELGKLMLLKFECGVCFYVITYGQINCKWPSKKKKSTTHTHTPSSFKLLYSKDN